MTERTERFAIIDDSHGGAILDEHWGYEWPECPDKDDLDEIRPPQRYCGEKPHFRKSATGLWEVDDAVGTAVGIGWTMRDAYEIYLDNRAARASEYSRRR